MRIVLCGVKHCGKSTHGRLLAAARRTWFADSDALLLEHCGVPELGIRELYNRLGEEEFRKAEAAVIRALPPGATADGVLALGGGTLSNEFLDAATLRRLGLLIYIAVPPDEALRRVLADGGLPPFLRDETEFRRQYAERDALCRRMAQLVWNVPPGLTAVAADADLQKLIMEHEKQ